MELMPLKVGNWYKIMQTWLMHTDLVVISGAACETPCVCVCQRDLVNSKSELDVMSLVPGTKTI